MLPNNEPWLREYDALIAERADGRSVFWLPFPGKQDPHWIRVTKDGRDAGWYDPIPHYEKDLLSIARAQESWRAQDVDHRSYGVETDTDGLGFKAWCIDSDGKRHIAYAPTESAARALALLRALKEGA
jgi:hypothetical protein